MSPKPEVWPPEEDDVTRAKRLLEDVAKKGSEVAQRGREITEAGSQAADMADAARGVLAAEPSIAKFLLRPFGMVREQLDLSLARFDTASLTSATTSLGSSMAFLTLGLPDGPL